jgi:hypothetical protein
MRSELALTAFFALSSLACDGRPFVFHPSFGEDSLLTEAEPVPPESLPMLRGLFTTDGTLTPFGPLVSVYATATTVSIFGDEGARYAVLEAGCLDGGTRLVLEGEHRVAVDVQTGLLRLEVAPVSLASALCAGDVGGSDPMLHAGARLEGSFGEGDAAPDAPAGVSFARPLSPMNGFTVASHRGMCRTTDDCGASENSIESVRRAEQFGATMIEVDVRFTRDDVAVLYHDATLSSRLTRGRYCIGNVGDLTLAHLLANCRLEFGEAIPTVEEALDVALEETSLSAVWLDVKAPGDVEALAEITARVHARAVTLGRDFTVYLGCPSREVYDAFLAIDRADVPCLVELGLDETVAAGCAIWAPRYTLGPMADEVARARSLKITTHF